MKDLIKTTIVFAAGAAVGAAVAMLLTPKTGEEIQIGERGSAIFKPGKGLKQAVED